MAAVPSAQNSTLTAPLFTEQEGIFVTVERGLRFLTLQDKWFTTKGKLKYYSHCTEADSVLFQGKLQCSKSCN